MRRQRPDAAHDSERPGGSRADAPTPGKRTRVSSRYGTRTRDAGRPLEGGVRGRMENLMGESLADVTVHDDGRAEQAGARALATGSEVHFAQGAYAPGSPGGDFLLGHELAHVVQQRGGASIQAKGGALENAGDRGLEAEADRVGRSIAAGQSVVGTIRGRAMPGAAQHFESDEHREIGDDATRGANGEVQTVELASDYRITYGEMVAMAGDFFADLATMKRLAAQAGTGRGTREEIEYVRVVKVHGRQNQEDNFSQEARDAVNRRYYGLAANNASHFVNPSAGNTGLSTADKIRLDVGASAFYRRGHLAAVNAAVAAGKDDSGIDTAMASEAFAAHYLTDTFAAGHLRTPRTGINDHWNRLVPMFFYNFKGFLAEKLAYYINDHNTLIGMATVDLIWGQAKSALTETLDTSGMPEFKFGDLVSGAIHDYDNKNGVSATVNGSSATLFGDGSLDKGDTKRLAMAAVQAGVADIRRAYQMSKSGSTADVIKAALVQGGTFAAERMIPEVTPDASLPEKSKSIKWDYDDYMQLLNDGKFQVALQLFLREKKSELAAIGETLDADYKKEAFRNGVLPLLDGFQGVTTISNVVNWTPNTGGGVGGHNQDDNALDYYKAAKSSSALGTLTYYQRYRIIQDLLNGATVGDEEDAILSLLKTASGSDARKLIQSFGWQRLYDEIDDGWGEEFKETFPKKRYSS